MGCAAQISNLTFAKLLMVLKNNSKPTESTSFISAKNTDILKSHFRSVNADSKREGKKIAFCHCLPPGELFSVKFPKKTASQSAVFVPNYNK